MEIGICADHEGFELKEYLRAELQNTGHDVTDFGANELVAGDDYPDYVLPLAKAVVDNEIERGVAICGSGVGVNVCANKVPGIRAGLCHDFFSAQQGVEDDDMNVLCLGSRVVDADLAWELLKTFLAARFSGAERHRRRLEKVAAIETMSELGEKPSITTTKETECKLE